MNFVKSYCFVKNYCFVKMKGCKNFVKNYYYVMKKDYKSFLMSYCFLKKRGYMCSETNYYVMKKDYMYFLWSLMSNDLLDDMSFSKNSILLMSFLKDYTNEMNCYLYVMVYKTVH
jgi:hypothetical protein